MATIGVLGLGPRGAGISRNLLKGKHHLQAFGIDVLTVRALRRCL